MVASKAKGIKGKNTGTVEGELLKKKKLMKRYNKVKGNRERNDRKVIREKPLLALVGFSFKEREKQKAPRTLPKNKPIKRAPVR